MRSRSPITAFLINFLVRTRKEHGLLQSYVCITCLFAHAVIDTHYYTYIHIYMCTSIYDLQPPDYESDGNKNVVECECSAQNN